MPVFTVSFDFQGTREEVDLIVNRIIENYEPLNYTEPVDAHAEWREELKANGFTPEQIEYLVKARVYVDGDQTATLEDLQDELGYGVVDEAVLRDTFFKDRPPERPLTDEEKARVLADYKAWSGGFEPSECDESEQVSYLRFAADATLPRQALQDFIMGPGFRMTINDDPDA